MPDNHVRPTRSLGTKHRRASLQRKALTTKGADNKIKLLKTQPSNRGGLCPCSFIISAGVPSGRWRPLWMRCKFWSSVLPEKIPSNQSQSSVALLTQTLSGHASRRRVL